MAAITDLGALAARLLFEPVAGWLQAFGGSAPPAAAALNAALDRYGERDVSATPITQEHKP